MVSYIIPVYNSHKTLEKCVKSITNQKYKDIELLLLDDGSDDDSLAIACSLAEKDSRIRVYSHKNRGASYTRNRGIKLAEGEYIQFVDADDYIIDDMTGDLLNKVEENNLDICICRFFYHSDRKDEDIPEFYADYGVDFYKYFEKLMRDNLLQGPCNKIYKKSIIDQNGISFPVGLDKYEDSIFNAKYLACCDRIGFVPKDYYFYNLNNRNSLSKTINQSDASAVLSFYNILINRKAEGMNKIYDYVLAYAIQQFEVMYRVAWLSTNDKPFELWNVYSDDMETAGGIALLQPYAKKVGIRYRIFFSLLKNRRFKLLLADFNIIEWLKSVLKGVRR